MEAPIKSKVFCSSFMHFWSAFGGAIFQIINAECSMVLYLLRFFALFFMQAILSTLASWLLISRWNGVTA